MPVLRSLDSERMNVLYVGQSVPNMVMEPIHLALMRVANVRTLWVPHPRLGTIKWPMKHLLKPLELTKEFLPQEPDLILVVEVFRKVKGLEKFHCPKFYYVQDPHISLQRYIGFANLSDYDRVFVTQKDSIEPLYLALYEELPRLGFGWLPPAFDPLYFDGEVPKRDIDVVFIGRKNTDATRAKMIEAIGAQTPSAYQHSMGQVLRRSKIIFNRSHNGDLNPRVFEGMAAGGMIITDRIANGLFDLFEEGVHLRTYASEEELTDLVKFYLKNEFARELIAERGMMEVKAKHTYIHRAKEIMECCE